MCTIVQSHVTSLYIIESVPRPALTYEDESHRLDSIPRSLRLHPHARAVLTDCAGPLASEWMLWDDNRDLLGDPRET